MADYPDPAAPSYHPPHHQQRFYGQQQQQQYHHHSSSSAGPTTSNERHTAGGEASGPTTGGLQRNDSSTYTNVYGDDDTANGRTSALDPKSQSQSTSGTRYFELRTPVLARDSTGSSSISSTTNTTTGAPATSASAAASSSGTSSYASASAAAAAAAATPTQTYAQPQQAYDNQQYAHQHQQEGHQEQLIKREVSSSFDQSEQQQQHSYANVSSPVGGGLHQQQHQNQQQQQRHQDPQFLLPPPPSFRQPTLPYLPAHPDGTIPHYTFGASPLNASDHAAPKVGQTRCCASREDLALWKDQERIAFDSNYLAADLVINWVADGLVLCFIHAIVDLSKQDNDEKSKTPWTNWCGAALMDERHSAGLARALESPFLMNPPHSTFTHGPRYANPAPVSPATTSTTSTSPSPHNEDVVPGDSYDRSYSSLERNGAPNRIFQILRNDESRELICSYPRGGYDPKHISSLTQGVSMAPYGEPGSDEYAKTNCTRRLECTRAIPDPRSSASRKVNTLYIPHGQVIFASHRMDSDEEKNQHYHPFPSPAYDDSQAGPGALYSRNQEDVPPTPSSYSSQEQPLHGYNSYPSNSYGRTNSHYSGSWPPSHENRAGWEDSYSASGTSYPGYGAGQAHSSALHSRTQQTPSLRSTQSSQNLYGQGPTSSTGFTPPETRNPLPYSRTSSGFANQGSYPTYSGNGHQWNSTNGSWEEHTSAPLPPREIQQTSASRYHEPYSHPQQMYAPDTPVSAQSQQYFQDNVSTALRPVRIPTGVSSRHSPTGMKRSADEMLCSGGSASGSGDERSASPPQGNVYPYNGMAYNDGSPPGSLPRSLVQVHREPGGSRTNGNPPPGVQKCVSCGIDNSPEWRKGENGVKNLCNACGLRYARSKQKREGIIPQRRKKKDKGPNAKVKKIVKGKRQGGDSASPPPSMRTPPEEKAQPMDLVDDHPYRDPSPGYRGQAPSQYYYGTADHHHQYQS
ncbi:hypothetical protein FRC01_001163 [Tulasnella sp. 417]|nr:hypothetical protein FRC01_001163 [Tulasnella sp. 417]